MITTSYNNHRLRRCAQPDPGSFFSLKDLNLATNKTKNVLKKNMTKSKTVSISSKCGILNIPPYHIGELMHSFLFKTAMNNGFENVEEMLRKTQEINSKKTKNRPRDVNYDSSSNFTDTFDFDDSFDWLRSGTLYSELQAFSPYSPEARLRKYVTGVETKTRYMLYEELIYSLYSCPKCRKEEGGNWYFHKEHQMPFMLYCQKHKVRLERYNGLRFHEHEGTPEFEPLPGIFQEDRLAEFAAAIYNANFECSSSIIVGALNTKFMGMNSRNTVKPYIEERYPLIGSIPTIAMCNFSEKRTPLPPKYSIPFISYLFDTPEEFMYSVALGPSYHEKFLEAIHGKFEMLTEYHNDAVKVRCLECGAVYYVYPPTFCKNPVCYKEHNVNE